MPTACARASDATGRVTASGAGKPMSAWRQPVVWLGLAVFVASMIGCIAIIVLAVRHDGSAPAGGVEHLMKMPINRLPVAPGAGPGPQ
jgi:hypothetical protein